MSEPRNQNKYLFCGNCVTGVEPAYQYWKLLDGEDKVGVCLSSPSWWKMQTDAIIPPPTSYWKNSFTAQEGGIWVTLEDGRRVFIKGGSREEYEARQTNATNIISSLKQQGLPALKNPDREEALHKAIMKYRSDDIKNIKVDVEDLGGGAHAHVSAWQNEEKISFDKRSSHSDIDGTFHHEIAHILHARGDTDTWKLTTDTSKVWYKKETDYNKNANYPDSRTTRLWQKNFDTIGRFSSYGQRNPIEGVAMTFQTMRSRPDIIASKTQTNPEFKEWVNHVSTMTNYRMPIIRRRR